MSTDPTAVQAGRRRVPHEPWQTWPTTVRYVLTRLVEILPTVMYRIADAVVVLSLGRTAIYEQIRSGRLRSVTQGRTRLIPASAIKEYIALLEREADAA